MSEINILEQIAQKEFDKEKIAEQFIKEPELMGELLKGLQAAKARIKYGCEKVLRIIGEKKPEMLYPHWDIFIQMMNGENKFLKWGAILTIANLTRVDSDNKFEKIFDNFFSPIRGPVMITAASIIGSAAIIARAKPNLSEKITRKILLVDKAKYQTAECRNVAIGHAIDSFEKFFEQIKDQEPIIRFVKKQLKNTRVPVRKRAEKFINKFSIDAA